MEDSNRALPSSWHGLRGVYRRIESFKGKRELLKVGAVFLVGLLLQILQFGPGSIKEVLYWFSEPFTSWRFFVQDGVVVLWFSLAVLMLLSMTVAVCVRRWLWVSYLSIAGFWFWTYARLAISF